MRTRMMVLSMLVGGLFAGAAVASEYHASSSNLCSDCHTMHFSMQHGFDGGAVSATPVEGGNWLSTTGPNDFLLKAPANELCKACHDGQTFAPDVVGTNANAMPVNGRQGGALNDAGTVGYESWMGHTLDSTTTPPGYDAAFGHTYDPAGGLECISCHTQHGSATAYRNLGWRSAAFAPSYVINTTNDTTKDVWVNIPTGFVGGSGDAAVFNPYYATANIFYNRIDAVNGTIKTSNKLDNVCAGCHANFHGGSDDGGGVGGTAGEAFKRHPTAQTVIGAMGGGHSALTNYTGRDTDHRVKVYTTDYTGFTDASPGCVSCHKAHGNQNPFGLVFLQKTGSVDENGTTTDADAGYKALCQNCHKQAYSD